MKSAIAYYLIWLYFTVLFKPLVPVISDGWAHAFNEAARLSTVHAHQGENHLEAVLADKAPDTSAGKNQKACNLEEQYTSHICPPVFRFDFSYSKPNKHYSIAKPQKIVAVFVLKQGPPPKDFIAA